jgi:hypothetical protein
MAPVRAWFVVTPALNGTATVHVHVIYLDILFMNHEQSLPRIVRTFQLVLSDLKVCGEISR